MLTLTSVPFDHEVFAEARFSDSKWLHHRVMRIFGELGDNAQARKTGEVLFRCEPWVGTGRVLVQSMVAPVVDGVRSTPLTPVLAGLESGQEVRFLLHANVVRTVNRTGPDGKTRKYRADVPSDQRLGWLAQRLGPALATIEAPDPQVASSRLGPQGKLLSVNYTGSATVTDPQKLVELVRDGIGRGKAYGCGMLSVAPRL